MLILSFSFSHQDTFGLSFSVVDKNLILVLVLVTQVSHQNECNHTANDIFYLYY